MKNKVFLCWLISILLLEACQTTSTPPPATTQARPTAIRTRAPAPPTWTPTLTPTAAATMRPRRASTSTPTRTPMPTYTPSPTAIATATPILSPSATISPTLDEDGNPITPTLTITPTPTITPEPVTKILLGDFNPDQALDLIYGIPNANARINTLLVAPFQQDDATKYALITEVPGRPCPACKASVGGAIFARTDGGWKIELEQKHITTMGSYGRAPTSGELVDAGPDKYGLLFREVLSDTTSTYTNAILIIELAGELSPVLNTRIAAQGIPASWSYTSTVEFISGDNNLYDDIHITTRGTQLINNEVTPFEQHRIFVFSRPTYQEIENSAQP